MKRIRVQMGSGRISCAEPELELPGLGGRGLTSQTVAAEVPPACDALGLENRLVIAPGALSGTSLVSTSRLSVGAKSPLTGGIKESNVGGTVAAALGRLGIGSIVVEGAAPSGSQLLLRIDAAGQAALHPADTLAGLGTYETAGRLVAAYGPDNGILCIGPAGERRLLSASIQATDVDGRPCRAAGRGGLGAVMGSKGLKAVVVAIPARSARPPRNAETFRRLVKEYVKIVREHPLTGEALPTYGTAMSVALINRVGAFSSFNATQGVFPGWEKISGEALAEMLRSRGGRTGHMGCSQCIIRCSNLFVDDAGKFVTSSLEYETIWAGGAMCGIDDLDTIARFDRLCDDLGLDTVNTGVAIAVAMDAGYCSFGDREAALKLLAGIGEGSELALAVGNGPAAVGRMLGHERVPVVKNQAVPAYDPRAIQGMAVTYATSPMGADHTAGYVVAENLASGGPVDPLRPEGQVELSRNAQIRTAFMDCTGLCSFATSAVKHNPRGEQAIVEMVNHVCGTALVPDDIQRLGRAVLKLERQFNRQAGLTPADDRLARMFYEEPLPPHNVTVAVRDEQMDEVFDFLDSEQRQRGST